MKQLAIIGPTASGKSALALELADRYRAAILSIDSLSIYQQIDIASAKPTHEELASVPHFGIDVLSPDKHANVFTFIDEYHRARSFAQEHGMNLLLIGGSSFYLKSMLDGLSELPPISTSVRDWVADMLLSPEKAHAFLTQVDPESASKIAPHDRYRLEKLLHLYCETSIPPSKWFATHPPQAILQHCPVLNLTVDRSLLRTRIDLRTGEMVKNGLIDEVAYLEKRYGRLPNSMKAIGIVETLEYLDGHIDKHTMIHSIATHTAQLAKRQVTFNTHQFANTLSGTAEALHSYAQTLLS